MLQSETRECPVCRHLDAMAEVLTDPLDRYRDECGLARVRDQRAQHEPECQAPRG